ncbi:coagulation factor IX-like isoform X2 [Antedon mediterranea]|uniref:coagulation factor IX-like isoform X2 n=1 Tax=Antedon mediterranea TaxID=105859 RepID=UPI003AF4D223
MSVDRRTCLEVSKTCLVPTESFVLGSEGSDHSKEKQKRRCRNKKRCRTTTARPTLSPTTQPLPVTMHNDEPQSGISTNTPSQSYECGRPVFDQVEKILMKNKQWTPALDTIQKSSPNLQAANGHLAIKGSSPWIVQLWHTKFVQMICAGVLLNRHWVLTAAHCIHTTNGTKQTLRVQLGDHDLELPEVGQRTYNIREVIVHENFNNDTFDNDIVLLKIEGSIDYSNFIIPCCLPELNEHELELFNSGEFGKVVGWGKLSQNGPYPRYLNEIQLPIVSQKICRESTSYPVTDNMFCAGNGRAKGPDACTGDSGAPLTINDGSAAYLIGIVSWGEGCGNEGKYGFYTRISNYYSWLEQHMGPL